MTLIEAGAKYKLNPDTLRVAIFRKQLGAVKRGRDWHVSELAVETYMARGAKKDKKAE